MKSTFRTSIAVLAAVLAVSLSGAESQVDYKPTPPDRAQWVKHQSEHFTRLSKILPAKELLFLGDSITAQWIAPTNTKWPGGLDTWKQLFAKRALNFGTSGDRIEDVLWRITEGKQLDGCKFQIIILMIGTNNILGSKKIPQTPEQIAHGNKQIIDIIKAKQPQAKIILQSIIPLNFDGGVRDKMVAEVNPHLQKLADGKTVFYLDLNPVFLDKNGKKVNLRDGVHPSPEGYQRMGALLDAEIKRIGTTAQPAK